MEREEDRNVLGEEGEEVKSPKRNVIRVESEETQDYVRESLNVSQEKATCYFRRFQLSFEVTDAHFQILTVFQVSQHSPGRILESDTPFSPIFHRTPLAFFLLC